MKLEVICHTQEDQQKLAREGIIPDYIPQEVKARILSGPWKYGAMEQMMRKRGMKKSIENKHFPVTYM